MIGKFAHSHSYTHDHWSPSSSLTSSSSTESGVGPGGADQNWIQVQPHCVFKEKKPILDYDSNDNFDNYDTITCKPAILHFQEFNDLSAFPQEGWMEDYTIVTQENPTRFPKVPQESSSGFPKATQENSAQFSKATQENSGRFSPATQDNGGRFLQASPLNSDKISRVNFS
jgi:hypothetical protein